jgi:ribosomal protein S18 acetylase RimI-like enzyme
VSDFTLRPATDADRDFLLEVYTSTRAVELGMLPWDDAAKRAFVEQQFNAQDVHYRRFYADAAFDVVEVAGEPAGRLTVLRGAEDIRIVDIALLEAFRGRGIGTALLQAVLDEAGDGDHSVSIHVEVTNPARALYARLGFRVTEDDGPYLQMAWTATAVMEA